MNVKQISVVLANKPGTLCNIVEALEEKDISIRALTLTANEDTGVLRLIVDNVLWTSAMLQNLGYSPVSTDVVLINVSEVPGELGGVLEIFRDNHVNIKYTYSIMSKNKTGDGHVILSVFEVDDYAHAVDVLNSKGVHVMNQQELLDL